MTVKDCLERLAGLNQMVGNSRTDKGYHRPDEVVKHQRYIEAMMKVCQQARAQGTPRQAGVGLRGRAYPGVKFKSSRSSVVVPTPEAVL